MKPCCILLGCMIASLCILSGGASAQVITEFSTGISAGGFPYRITAGPDGNLWFTEFSGSRIGWITRAA
jgi:streptogramin lyase